jgi:hypothetical protein
MNVQVKEILEKNISICKIEYEILDMPDLAFR